MKLEFIEARNLPDIPPALGIPNPVADGYIEEYLPYLMTSAKQPGEDYTYGQYLEHQIEEAFRIYREDGQIIAASKGLHLYDYVWELAKLRTMCHNPSALAEGTCLDES